MLMDGHFCSERSLFSSVLYYPEFFLCWITPKKSFLIPNNNKKKRWKRKAAWLASTLAERKCRSGTHFNQSFFFISFKKKILLVNLVFSFLWKRNKKVFAKNWKVGKDPKEKLWGKKSQGSFVKLWLDQIGWACLSWGLLLFFFCFLPLSIVYVLLAYAVEARRVWVSSTQQQSPLFLSLFSASSLDGKFLKSPPLPA